MRVQLYLPFLHKVSSHSVDNPNGKGLRIGYPKKIQYASLADSKNVCLFSAEGRFVSPVPWLMLIVANDNKSASTTANLLFFF